MKFKNEAERALWEQVIACLITEENWRLACGSADRIVEAQRDRYSDLCGSAPPQGASPSVPVEPQPEPAHEDPVHEEAQKMLVSQSGPFGDVTGQIIESENLETHRRILERARLQARIDANLDSEWDPELQNFVVVDRPLPERVRNSLIAWVKRLDEDIARRLAAKEPDSRLGIFVNPERPSAKLHIELDRSELCPGARYAVQWQGVLVGYERMEDAEAAFEATQGNMAKGEELNLVLLTQVKHYVAPGATRAVAEESQPHVEAEKDPVR